jgi:hypothetical protein
MTLAVLEVPDVLMIWKCSVPETADRAGDAPAGIASHRAAVTVATAVVAAVAKEMMRGLAVSPGAGDLVRRPAGRRLEWLFMS